MSKIDFSLTKPKNSHPAVKIHLLDVPLEPFIPLKKYPFWAQYFGLLYDF